MENIVKVTAQSGTYEVHIGKHLDYGELLKNTHKSCNVVLISDDVVFPLYGERTKEQLKSAGFTVETFIFANGENSKNWQTAGEILEFAAERNLSKSDLFVALGGGVVGDITGFAASVFLRGISYVQLPTTLLAAVDSSVGGKTAVDLLTGKNLAGAFHQPIAVFCDTETFHTLPKEIFADGMAETIKYGVIRDEALFQQLNQEQFDICEVCRRCVTMKAEIVARDEFDCGERKLLNYGHTPGHAIELLSAYQISHGSAVAIGMVMMMRAAEADARIESGSTKRLISLLQKFDLPVTCDFTAEEMARVAMADKKRAGGHISLVFPERIGNAVITDVDIHELEAIFQKGLG